MQPSRPVHDDAESIMVTIWVNKTWRTSVSCELSLCDTVVVFVVFVVDPPPPPPPAADPADFDVEVEVIVVVPWPVPLCGASVIMSSFLIHKQVGFRDAYRSPLGDDGRLCSSSSSSSSSPSRGCRRFGRRVSDLHLLSAFIFLYQGSILLRKTHCPIENMHVMEKVDKWREHNPVMNTMG